MSICEMIMDNLMLLWDGIGFFGTAHHKLGRCEGKPVHWYDKCFEPTYLIMLLISITVPTYIILTEFNELGEPKSQFSELIPQDLYRFPAHNTMPLHGIL